MQDTLLIKLHPCRKTNGGIVLNYTHMNQIGRALFYAFNVAEAYGLNKKKLKWPALDLIWPNLG